jgi:hypothetical protein
LPREVKGSSNVAVMPSPRNHSSARPSRGRRWAGAR